MQPKNSIEPMKIPDRGRHLDMEVFINRILNYRYHWHETKYEVTTVLRGRAIYSRGGEAVELGEDDLMVIEPLMGHASLALEKGTLTMTAYFGYNRTYLSTFFKTNTGLNFHDYLTRIRLKHSLSDLAYTDKQMTAIALDNGFPDLKTFTVVFKSNFHTTPLAYRQTVQGVEKAESVDSRILLDPHDPFVLAKLSSYSQRGLVS